MRAAVSTTNQIIASAAAKLPSEDVQALFIAIRDYLKCNEDSDDEEVDFEALQKVKEST